MKVYGEISEDMSASLRLDMLMPLKKEPQKHLCGTAVQSTTTCAVCVKYSTVIPQTQSVKFYIMKS